MDMLPVVLLDGVRPSYGRQNSEAGGASRSESFDFAPDREHRAFGGQPAVA
jgi:hypothetical protein